MILTATSAEEAIEIHRAEKADLIIADLEMQGINPQVLFQKVNDLLSICRRESLLVLIKVSVRGMAEDCYFFSTSQNISTTGILLETDKVLAKGDRIACSFFLNASQVTADGETVRVVKKTGEMNQYGMKFVDLTPKAKPLIEKFIKRSRSH